MVAPPQSDVSNAISKGQAYLLRLYKEIASDKAVLGEYPSLPFWIYVHNTGVKHLAGTKYCKVVPVSGGTDYETYKYCFEDMDEEIGETPDWDYDEPVARVTITYYSSTSMKIDVTIEQASLAYTVDLYLDDTLLFSDVKTKVGQTVTIYRDTLPSVLYTVRHVSRMASLLFYDMGETAKSQKLLNVVNTYFGGKMQDPYETMFRYPTFRLGDLAVKDPVWYDCIPSVFNNLPRGTYNNRPFYPYKSLLACSDVVLTVWILANTVDTLWWGWKANYFLHTDSSKAKKVVEANALIWDGNGITNDFYNLVKASGALKGYSTVRNAVALIVYSRGAFNGWWSWDVADAIASRLIYDCQWNGEGYAYINGSLAYIRRPWHRGGFMVGYDTYSPAYAFRTPRDGWMEGIRAILSWFGATECQNKDFYGILPTNAEATIACVQALRYYASLRY